MLNIEFKENLDDKIYELIDTEFNKYAIKNKRNGKCGNVN